MLVRCYHSGIDVTLVLTLVILFDVPCYLPWLRNAHVASFITVVLCCCIQVAQMGGQPEQGNREQVG